MSSKGIIDVHCHLFQDGDMTHGYINPEFKNSRSFHLMLWTAGLMGGKDLLSKLVNPKNTLDLQKYNEKYTTLLIDSIEDSIVDHVVLFPFDAVYDEDGFPDRDKTIKYVSNDTTFEVARASSKILPAGSINPLRRDWENELEKCIENNVALIKWLPNLMGFDPADERIIPFYERLRDAGIPLLSHVGFEKAARVDYPEYSDLDHLHLPLDIGVRVIGAHCCQALPLIDDVPFQNNPNNFSNVVKTVEKYPNLYLDSAAMSLFYRKPRLRKALKNASTNERLLFGSDFPIAYLKGTSFRELGFPNCLKPGGNYFTTDCEIKRGVGLNSEAFSRGYSVINQKSLAFHS